MTKQIVALIIAFEVIMWSSKMYKQMRSVNDFFEDISNKGAVRVNDKKEAEVVVVVDDSSQALAAAATAVLAESAFCHGASSSHRKRRSDISTDQLCLESTRNQIVQQSCTLKFITWNIAGLCEKNLVLRTKAVCKAVLDEQADIAFLQEVVPESAQYILQNLPNYHCLFGNEVGYFVGTLLKKSTVNYKEFQVIDFETRMMRNALKNRCCIQKQNFTITEFTP
ncbi:tyrosyl-DNA phosphodiesterase 2 [Caerostris extrusa]|uniref:Tyrosyl-DNA phosphodiesterase 2 n=1 Tax=Caerostris extrusa TaxID=172846 RepID=A0AAV4QC97_CAEEX|nr:tyrosyl-DNA phosphodiesterase 2 [Caerostris extrusa]